MRWKYADQTGTTLYPQGIGKSKYRIFRPNQTNDRNQPPFPDSITKPSQYTIISIQSVFFFLSRLVVNIILSDLGEKHIRFLFFVQRLLQ